MAQPSSPPLLMEELVEEILLRLPPQEPASLVRAALVCKPWRRLIAGRRFRCRFLELHRTPPMLGFLCNHHHGRPRFVRRTAFSPLHALGSNWRGLDARHGRVLLREPTDEALVVWDPIADERRGLPFPPRRASSCTAAVLCAAATAGTCDHRDCQRGPFLVVFVGTDPWSMFLCTYSSEFGAWSDPISIQHPNNSYIYAGYSPTVLLGNKLYFGVPMTNTALQYDVELRETSWIQLPTLQNYYQRSVLTTTEDGLGLVSLLDGKLCMWLRMDTPEADAGWMPFKTIDLGSLLHVNPDFIPHASVVGFADGLDIVFMAVNGALYTVDLRTNMVKKVYNGRPIYAVFPYMRFYSPALEAISLGEEPSVAGSSARQSKVHVRSSWAREN